MTPIRIFISSVQKEFAGERKALVDYLRNDPLMRRCFEGFLFEESPASDRRPDKVYLDEVERCDIYVGLFGKDYGAADDTGLSPTEREFDHATALGKHRLIFLKNMDPGVRHPKMQALIGKAEAGLIRKRFDTQEELVIGLYAALVEYLEDKELLRFGPFDAAPCEGAALDDLDTERMTRFIRTARGIRQFPLDENTPPEDLLKHLNLLNKGRLTNAAVLLFGKAPQRFLISSEIKCAHFHGTQVAKPIPSYQVYKGTVFDLVDQAVDFVLSKVALSIGTRAETIEVPTAYEIPKEVVTEAIVNAVVHRDYTDNSSVQVMLFSDRLDVMNTGQLPPPLTVEKLRVPHESLPRNPLLAESMYLAGYIERMGTGTVDMIRRCAAVNLREPEFVASGGFVTTIRRPDYATQLAKVQGGVQAGVQEGVQAGVQEGVQAGVQEGVQAGGQPESDKAGVQEGVQAVLSDKEIAMLQVCVGGAVTSAMLLRTLGYSSRTRNFRTWLDRLLKEDLLEMTIPDKPRSPNQKYRLTDKGRAVIENLRTEGTES